MYNTTCVQTKGRGNGVWLSLARALDLGSRGRRFESCHPDYKAVTALFYVTVFFNASHDSVSEKQTIQAMLVELCGCSSMVEH